MSSSRLREVQPSLLQSLQQDIQYIAIIAGRFCADTAAVPTVWGVISAVVGAATVAAVVAVAVAEALIGAFKRTILRLAGRASHANSRSTASFEAAHFRR